VNATLTKKGRELLSQGSNRFNITKFALGDDEIDYSLWNANHASGSDWYGHTIEQTPIFEALPDETIVLRSKLVTLPKGVTSMPYIKVSPQTITLQFKASALLNATTLNGATGYDDRTAGYTCILHNKSLAILEVTKTAPSQPSDISNLPSDIFNDATNVNSSYAIGLEFKITAKDVTNIYDGSRSCLITIHGNETSTNDTISLTVTPPPVRTTE
jgi:hypothetical protein